MKKKPILLLGLLPGICTYPTTARQRCGDYKSIINLQVFIPPIFRPFPVNTGELQNNWEVWESWAAPPQGSAEVSRETSPLEMKQKSTAIKTSCGVEQNTSSAGIKCLVTQSSCRLDFSLSEISILEGLTPVGALEFYPGVHCVSIHVQALSGWQWLQTTGLRTDNFPCRKSISTLFFIFNLGRHSREFLFSAFTLLMMMCKRSPWTALAAGRCSRALRPQLLFLWYMKLFQATALGKG